VVAVSVSVVVAVNGAVAGAKRSQLGW